MEDSSTAATPLPVRPQTTSIPGIEEEIIEEDRASHPLGVENNAGRGVEDDPSTINEPNSRGGGGFSFVLTPSRLRMHSRVLAVHTTTLWLLCSIFSILILLKLNGVLYGTPWPIIFIPMWISHTLQIVMNISQIKMTEVMITRQIGPPPPETASLGLHLHYNIVFKTRARSHLIDAVNALLDTIAMAIAQALFCWCLASNQLGVVPLRLIFTPFWVDWVVATVLNCMKDPEEKVFGGTRDLMHLFLLMVALKVDGLVDYNWSIVFVVPWIWFTVIFLMAWIISMLLLFARVWARIKELLLPLGFFLLLISMVPQFISYVNLVKMLGSPGTSNISFESILIPNAVSWFSMWISSLIFAWGLRSKELDRDALLASGAVWTMHEQFARRAQQRDMDVVKQKIDRLSDEEVAAMVGEIMASKTKPSHLKRIGNILYRRLDATCDEAEASGEPPTNEALTPSLITPQHSEVDATTQLPGNSTDRDHGQSRVQEQGLSGEILEACNLAVAAAADDDQVSSSQSVSLSAARPSPGFSFAPMNVEQSPSSGVPRPSSGAASSRRIAGTSQDGQRTKLRPMHQASLPSPSLPDSFENKKGFRPLSSSRVAPSDVARPSLGQGHSGGLLGLIQSMDTSLGLSAGPTMAGVPNTIPEGPDNTKVDIDAGDDLCIICYDQPPSCVFLECGHAGCCRRCAFLLFVRPPNECPTCRQPIDQVVELSDQVAIEQVSRVK